MTDLRSTDRSPTLIHDQKCVDLWRACAAGDLDNAQMLFVRSGYAVQPDTAHALFFTELLAPVPPESVRVDSAAWRALDNLEALMCRWPIEALARCSPLLNLLCALRSGDPARVARFRSVAPEAKPRSALVVFRAAAYGRPEIAEQLVREAVARGLTATLFSALFDAMVQTCASVGMSNSLVELDNSLVPLARAVEIKC